MTLLVTGGAGFIGSNFVLDWLASSNEPVVTLDALTYAGNLGNLASIAADQRHSFARGSIGDAALVGRLLRQNQVRAVVNFAAESHVDRSISGPAPFFETNVMGTLHLLEAVRGYVAELAEVARGDFRFLHVSTDEVYGTLRPDDPAFTETTPYSPNSPYAASKASSDHLVRSYRETFGLNTLVTNCSNNYGPYQFPEKLIPLMILNALERKPLPVYGRGDNVRDWLYVTDHCDAIWRVIRHGRIGETYNIGGRSERRNLDVVHAVCDVVAECTDVSASTLRDLVTFVPDRPGHDHRYAIDPAKIERECGFSPAETFETGLRKTVRFYLDHEAWVRAVRTGAYRAWIDSHYAGRV